MDVMLIQYDDALIGRYDDVDTSLFPNQNPGGANQRRALNIIRYAIERILEWDEETAIKKFDRYIIKLMKLERFLSYIDFPDEVPFGDPRYILSLLYPRKLKINLQELVEELYQTILDSEEGKQFPRDYFIGAIGFRRFCICVKYIIEQYHPISTLEELYTFFGSTEGRRFLSQYRLRIPAYQYSVDILRVIRYITSSNPNSDLYYCYYAFLSKYNGLVKDEDESEIMEEIEELDREEAVEESSEAPID